MSYKFSIRKANPRLVGITGGKGAGKDTVAQHLCDMYAFERIAYADKLRMALANIFDVSIALFTDPEYKETAFDVLYGKTPRYLMQTLGTEWGRDLISPTLWADLLYRQVAESQANGTQSIVIADVRFDNEAESIRKRGGVVWKIERPDPTYGAGDTHRSEGGVSPELIDTVIHNNMDKRMLFTQVGVAIANLDRQPSRPDNSSTI